MSAQIEAPIRKVATEVQAKPDVLYAQPGVPAPGARRPPG
jgi:hypothetical protein